MKVLPLYSRYLCSVVASGGERLLCSPLWKVTITVDDNLLSMLVVCGDKFHSPPKMELPFNNEFQIGDLKCYHGAGGFCTLLNNKCLDCQMDVFGGLLFALKDDALSLHLLFLQSKPVLQGSPGSLSSLCWCHSIQTKRGLWSRDIFICQDTKDWLFTLGAGCLITL